MLRIQMDISENIKFKFPEYINGVRLETTVWDSRISELYEIRYWIKITEKRAANLKSTYFMASNAKFNDSDTTIF